MMTRTYEPRRFAYLLSIQRNADSREVIHTPDP